jgi:hypothetical protein
VASLKTMHFLQRVGRQLQQKYFELGAPIQSVTM